MAQVCLPKLVHCGPLTRTHFERMMSAKLLGCLVLVACPVAVDAGNVTMTSTPKRVKIMRSEAQVQTKAHSSNLTKALLAPESTQFREVEFGPHNFQTRFVLDSHGDVDANQTLSELSSAQTCTDLDYGETDRARHTCRHYYGNTQWCQHTLI